MLNVVELQVQSFKEKNVLPSCSLNKSCRKQDNRETMKSLPGGSSGQNLLKSYWP